MQKRRGSPCAMCAATAMEQLKKAEKAGDISQDEHHARSDDIQKATDAHIKDIDELLVQKRGEIMQV